MGGGTPDRIRTYDLLLRRQTLYPAELRAHNRDTPIVDAFLQAVKLHSDGVKLQIAGCDMVRCFSGPYSSHGEVAEWSKAAVC